MKASIVIRTLNEARHLPALLRAIMEQDLGGEAYETIVVDSGSTDATLTIAREFDCQIVNIAKEDFSFGRSLNYGCRLARGTVLVFVSGHCIPEGKDWLRRLIAPLGCNGVVYSYGAQIGGSDSHFSECQIFAKYFPRNSKIPQDGFYCNNANAALLRSVWQDNPFDEDITGLEDMHLAKRLVSTGCSLAYIADARVYHLHEEGWRQIKRRFEREAIALQHIMPEIHLRFSDFLRYATSAILLDCGAALQNKRLVSRFGEIVSYRLCQFWGAYRGNNIHRKLSRARKEMYYYPR